jgi:hypothetical protein
MNKLNCLFCNHEEPEGVKPDGTKRKHIPVKSFICSRCTQVLLRASQESIKKAYLKAVELGFTGKAEYLNRMIEEDGSRDRKTEITKRNLVRKRPGRKIRLTGNQVRT